MLRCLPLQIHSDGNLVTLDHAGLEWQWCKRSVNLCSSRPSLATFQLETHFCWSRLPPAAISSDFNKKLQVQVKT